jgi:hypothetical protein
MGAKVKAHRAQAAKRCASNKCRPRTAGCHSREHGNPVATVRSISRRRAIPSGYWIARSSLAMTRTKARENFSPGGPARGEGMARRKAQTGSSRSLRDRAGASRRATRAHFCALPRFALLERSVASAHYKRMSFAASPQTVRHRASLSPQIRCLRASAGSQQGLIVVPGGAPMPPECFVATKPAGAAPRPTSRRLMSAPI